MDQGRGMSTSTKFGLLTCLYFSQGLPYGFFAQVLPVIMREDQATLPEISMTSLLALPWMLKFLWAPLVDRYGHDGIGAKKVWILSLQLLAVFLFLVLAALASSSGIMLLLVGYLLANLIAATQDIATDGLAVQLLLPHERGIGNGLQVAGYRLGMIIGGGAMLYLLAMTTRASTYLIMAGALLLATVPLLYYREPVRQQHRARPSLTSLVQLVRRPGMLLWLFVVGYYKFGDAMTTQMLRPFLYDTGFDKAAIGMFNGLGSAGGLIGALIGGWLVVRWGRYRAIVIFGVIQTVGVLAYYLISSQLLSAVWVFPVGIVEHLTGGMATAALFTAMMDVCQADTAATDYTTQASVVVMTTGAAMALSGFTAEGFGYQGNFILAGVLCLVGALLFALIYRRQSGSREAFSLTHPESIGASAT